MDGVIVSLSAETKNYDHFLELEEFGIPVVFFDRTPVDFPAHTVKSNVVEGANEAVNYLINKGLTKIAILNAAENLGVSQERLQGYKSAIQTNGLEVQEAYIKFTNLSKEDTEIKMLQLLALNDKPQAVFAFNDYIALNAMQVCKQQGFIPNKDIYFVSFANLPICTYLDNPPMASVEQFAYLMGQKSAELLVAAMNSEVETLSFSEVILDTKLYVNGHPD